MSQRTSTRIFAALLGTLLLAACAHLPKPIAAQTDTACGDLSEFYAEVSRLPPADSAALLDALRGNPRRPCDHLRLALLLSRPGTTYQDDAAAADALSLFLRDTDPMTHPARGLARLLDDDLAERRRLHTEAKGLQQRLAQAQDKSKTLQSRLQALQTQLNQLKSIERVINEKERNAARTPPGVAPPTTSNTP